MESKSAFARSNLCAREFAFPDFEKPLERGTRVDIERLANLGELNDVHASLAAFDFRIVIKLNSQFLFDEA